MSKWVGQEQTYCGARQARGQRQADFGEVPSVAEWSKALESER